MSPSEVIPLDTPEDWLAFEASLLTGGLFERLPFPSSIERNKDDESMVCLWRAVLTRALFDLLRGPLVDSRPPPKEPLDKSNKEEYQNYTRLMKKYNEVILPESRRIYRDAVHWLYGGRTMVEWYGDPNEDTESVRYVPTDFQETCDLAQLEPSFVRDTILRLMNLKKEKTGAL